MKRWLAGLCAALLCLGLLLPAALATEPTVYQMAVNDKFVDGDQINPATMPIVVDYSVYVPYTVFDRDSTGVNMGTAAGTRKENGLHYLTVYSREITLTFEINSGACWDSQGNNYDLRAVIRNNVIFVPADATCRLLGLDYTYYPTADRGILIRITSGKSLSIEKFVDSARSFMQQRYNSYLRSLTPQVSPPPPAVTVPATPSKPPSGGENPNHRDVSVLLAFRCGGGERLADILDTLDGNGISALFLFRPEDLADNDTLIRRMVGEGHVVGLITDGASAEQAEIALESGNDLLARIAWQRTRVVLVEGGDAAVAADLESSGWRCWQATVDGVPTGGASANTNRILAALERLTAKRARILLDDSAASSAALPRLITGLRADKYAIRSVVESQI